MDIPYRFLEQVIRSLRQNGFIKSYRGFNGGYQLARAASDITLLEVVEAIHGPIEITPCLEEPPDCDLMSECAAHEVWARIDDSIKRALGAVTFDKLKSRDALFATKLLN